MNLKEHKDTKSTKETEALGVTSLAVLAASPSSEPSCAAVDRLPGAERATWRFWPPTERLKSLLRERMSCRVARDGVRGIRDKPQRVQRTRSAPRREGGFCSNRFGGSGGVAISRTLSTALATPIGADRVALHYWPSTERLKSLLGVRWRASRNGRRTPKALSQSEASDRMPKRPQPESRAPPGPRPRPAGGPPGPRRR